MQQGGDFLSGFASGVLGSWAGSGFQNWEGVGNTTVGMYAFGGLSGGIGAAASGGNFWKGMGQGMIVTGLNHAAWETVASLKGKLPKVSGLTLENDELIYSTGCSEAVLKAFAEYLGIELPADFTLSTEAVDFRQAAEKAGLTVELVQKYEEWVNQIKHDNPVAATYIVNGRAHTVGIEQVQVRGKDVRLRVMDPDPIHTGRARRIKIPMKTIFQGANNIRRVIITK